MSRRHGWPNALTLRGHLHRQGCESWCPQGWGQCVYPQLAQQAHTRDVPGCHVRNACSLNPYGRGLQKRTGVFSLAHYISRRTLFWASHVARMPKNRAQNTRAAVGARTAYRGGGVEVK